jgi:hypothetical protein
MVRFVYGEGLTFFLFFNVYTQILHYHFTEKRSLQLAHARRRAPKTKAKPMPFHSSPSLFLVHPHLPISVGLTQD